STVQFATVEGGTQVVAPTSVAPGEIIVRVPDGTQAGSVVTVLRPGGTSLVSSPITLGVPVITGLSTTEGFAPGYSSLYLTSGSSVTIYGAGFRPGSKVQFGPSGTSNPIDPSLLVAATVSRSGESLTVNVPSAAVTGPIYVELPDGSNTP